MVGLENLNILKRVYKLTFLFWSKNGHTVIIINK